jgi:hypothetical protein
MYNVGAIVELVQLSRQGVSFISAEVQHIEQDVVHVRTQQVGLHAMQLS